MTNLPLFQSPAYRGAGDHASTWDGEVTDVVRFQSPAYRGAGDHPGCIITLRMSDLQGRKSPHRQFRAKPSFLPFLRRAKSDPNSIDHYHLPPNSPRPLNYSSENVEFRLFRQLTFAEYDGFPPAGVADGDYMNTVQRSAAGEFP